MVGQIEINRVEWEIDDHKIALFESFIRQSIVNRKDCSETR